MIEFCCEVKMKKKEYKKRLEKEKKEMRSFTLNDTSSNIKTTLIITACVVGFVLIMFAFTKIKTGEWDLFTKHNDPVYAAEAQTTKILCGQVLNRSDDEYFVLAYELKEDSVSLYDSILEKYNQSSSKIPLYKVDLSNSRNNICKSDTIKISNDITQLKLSVPTLIKIKNGKIVESYTTYDKIKSVLNSYVA